MQQQESERRVYTLREVSRLLGLTRQTVSRGIQRGDIPAIKIGGQYFIPVTAFERLLAGQRAPVRAGDK